MSSRRRFFTTKCSTTRAGQEEQEGQQTRCKPSLHASGGNEADAATAAATATRRHVDRWAWPWRRSNINSLGGDWQWTQRARAAGARSSATQRSIEHRAHIGRGQPVRE